MKGFNLARAADKILIFVHILCVFFRMKNVTLSVPDALLKKGRAYAAKHGTTLNALIRKLLQTTVEGAPAPKARMILEEMQRLNSPVKELNGSREDLHEG